MTYEIGNNKIKGNKANIGAGLYINNTTLEMRNDSISNNEAGSGGGVYLGYKTSFTMKESLTISGNKAKNGAGVYVDSGSSSDPTTLYIKKGKYADIHISFLSV